MTRPVLVILGSHATRIIRKRRIPLIDCFLVGYALDRWCQIGIVHFAGTLFKHGRTVSPNGPGAGGFKHLAMSFSVKLVGGSIRRLG